MRRTTTILLSIIALALLVIAVKPTPQAEAQPQFETPPRIVDLAFGGGTTGLLVRVWSDGVAEYRVLHLYGNVWIELPINPAAPLSHPVAVTAGPNGFFYRQWADGTVDWMQLLVSCPKECGIIAFEDWANLPEPP